MMKTLPCFVALAAVVVALACSSRTDPPGGKGPAPSPIASQSRNLVAAPGGHAPASSGPAAPGDPSRGSEVFEQYCGVCHGNGANGAPPLAGLFQRKELPSGTPANDDRVKDTIKMGRANMPGFTGVLTDQQVNDVVTYLHTQ